MERLNCNEIAMPESQLNLCISLPHENHVEESISDLVFSVMITKQDLSDTRRHVDYVAK